MALLSVLTALILLGFLAFVFILFQQFGKNLSQTEKTINEKLLWITQQVSERMRDNSQSLQNASIELGSKLDTAVKTVSDVREHLGKLEASQQKIYEVGKDISSLQDLLRAPKMRGGIGEFFLEDLLRQILPNDRFEFQYEFKSKERVDAVIKFAQALVPVDAKFPLENFRKMADQKDEKEKEASRRLFINDVKEHIRNISEKYIQPDEGTFDFALMYIPAENVYYETIIKDEKSGEGQSGLFQYALSKKVIPVSPHSFYAYLSVIVLGLRGMVIEKSAKAILQNISRLKIELGRFFDDFTKIGKHLANSRTSYADAEDHLKKFGEKLNRIELPSDKEAPLISER